MRAVINRRHLYSTLKPYHLQFSTRLNFVLNTPDTLTVFGTVGGIFALLQHRVDFDECVFRSNHIYAVLLCGIALQKFPLA